MSDTYHVFAVDSAHKGKHRVSSAGLSYNQAVEVWYALDDQRRAGLLPQTHFFAVRADDDPQWASAPYDEIYTKPAVEHTPRLKPSDAPSYINRDVFDHYYNRTTQTAAERVDKWFREEYKGRSAEAATRRAWKDRGGRPGTGGVFYKIGSEWNYDHHYRRVRRPYVARSINDLINYVLRRGWIVETANGYARVLVPSE